MTCFDHPEVEVKLAVEMTLAKDVSRPE